MVGAFHRHAHNRKCQLNWHPMYIPGTGHSEGEGCEHIFSASNALARGTQHASMFHWHQVIEQHFAFWNDDKYAALSNFLWNHYYEALKSVHTLTVELSAIKAELDITDDDFPQYILQECAYLDSLKQPPTRDQICIINQLRICWDSMREFANNALTGIATGMAHVEHQLAVEGQWEIGGNKYNRFKMEACLGKYRTALDDLEHLVVM
ncbi:hypothetical protein BDR05DRAFT_977789 [Suillus weaverae]|nr:hypothetical protein BDR05DRAFT_977789 [Suillus weaverae]